MFSIYTSAYNLNNGLFNWQERINEFSSFASEVCVATNNNYDYGLLVNQFKHNRDIKIINKNISLDDYAFDGKLKNAALQACTEPFCILLDLDERIPYSQYHNWSEWAKILSNPAQVGRNIDGLLIPSINLCGDELHYKDIGYKFYLHKNFVGIERGVVDFAKLDNGKIDITKSDTTEPLINGRLAKFMPVSKQINEIRSNNLPYVLHYWGVDKQKRIEQNKFWQPVWSNRAGKQINDAITNEEEFNKIEVFEHRLPIE